MRVEVGVRVRGWKREGEWEVGSVRENGNARVKVDLEGRNFHWNLETITSVITEKREPIHEF